MSKTLLIVGHVPSPNTQRLRDAVERGACELGAEGIGVRCLTPFEAGVPAPYRQEARAQPSRIIKRLGELVE